MNKSERMAQKADAITTLQALLPAGSTVYLSLSKVSRSGMSRTIKCMAQEKDGSLFNVSFFVAQAVELPFVEGYQGGVRINGCGMDMGLALIDSLSYALYEKPCDQTSSFRPECKRPNGGVGYKWI